MGGATVGSRRRGGPINGGLSAAYPVVSSLDQIGGYVQSFQKPLNRSGAISVYTTVLEMLECPMYAWMDRVSMPRLAKRKPQPCRSMCGCTEIPRPLPARAISFRTFDEVIGPARSDTSTN